MLSWLSVLWTFGRPVHPCWQLLVEQNVESRVLNVVLVVRELRPVIGLGRGTIMGKVQAVEMDGKDIRRAGRGSCFCCLEDSKVSFTFWLKTPSGPCALGILLGTEHGWCCAWILSSPGPGETVRALILPQFSAQYSSLTAHTRSENETWGLH